MQLINWCFWCAFQIMLWALRMLLFMMMTMAMVMVRVCVSVDPFFSFFFQRCTFFSCVCVCHEWLWCFSYPSTILTQTVVFDIFLSEWLARSRTERKVLNKRIRIWTMIHTSAHTHMIGARGKESQSRTRYTTSSRLYSHSIRYFAWQPEPTNLMKNIINLDFVGACECIQCLCICVFLSKCAHAIPSECMCDCVGLTESNRIQATGERRRKK